MPWGTEPAHLCMFESWHTEEFFVFDMAEQSASFISFFQVIYLNGTLLVNFIMIVIISENHTSTRTHQQDDCWSQCKMLTWVCFTVGLPVVVIVDRCLAGVKVVVLSSLLVCRSHTCSLHSDAYRVLTTGLQLPQEPWEGSIDPMHKWQQFKYSFVYIQISPTCLILGNIFFWKLNSRTRLVGLISM